ncbi:MAG: hypothetical protein AAB074_20340 [Planctomycetota bacterium]
MRVPVFFSAVFLVLGLAESAAALILVLSPEAVAARRPAPVVVEAPAETVALTEPAKRERNEIRCMATPPAEEDDGCLRCPDDEFLSNWPAPPADKGAPK